MGQPERFDLSRIAAQPWKNGAGVTRELASKPDGQGHFAWRFSVAEIERDAPFSAFPGVDRCIVLLQGAGMRLRAADGSVDRVLKEANEPFHFSGDLPLAATLLRGPSRDFNVMVSRGAFRAEVRHLAEAVECAGGAVTLLFCSEGEWQVDTEPPHTLGAMQALLWREPVAPMAVRPTHPSNAAHLLCVSLHAR